MKWSPEEYGGIQDVRFPYDALWKPDIILFNSADEKFDARFPVNFVVQHTGHVLQAPPAIVKSSCEIDITWFPFDEQICHLQYGSWTYTREHLDLFIDDTDLEGDHKMDLQYYVENGEWELIATPAQRKTADFGNNSFVELYFRLQIQRKTIYYGMNWIIPSILFLLSNVLGFTMPSECGEKITLQTTNLLSVTVFLGMVADVTPPTSKSVPIIAAFFSVSMIILGSSIIFTLLIINVHFRSPRTHKMSPWVRTAFLEWLPWLLLMNRPGKQFKKPKKHSRTTRSGDSISQLQKMRQPTFMTRQSDSVASRMGQVDSVNSTIMGTNKIAPRQFGLDPLERQSLLMEQQPGGTVRYHRLDGIYFKNKLTAASIVTKPRVCPTDQQGASLLSDGIVAKELAKGPRRNELNTPGIHHFAIHGQLAASARDIDEVTDTTDYHKSSNLTSLFYHPSLGSSNKLTS